MKLLKHGQNGSDDHWEDSTRILDAATRTHRGRSHRRQSCEAIRRFGNGPRGREALWQTISPMERGLAAADLHCSIIATRIAGSSLRSEERRVGKECRSRW